MTSKTFKNRVFCRPLYVFKVNLRRYFFHGYSSKVWFYRLPKFEAIRGVTLGILPLLVKFFQILNRVAIVTYQTLRKEIFFFNFLI